MDKLEVFAAGLGMVEPWRVVEATFDPEQGRLDLRIDFSRGAWFACPEGDELACPVHDTEAKTWRHLDFFQHQAYLQSNCQDLWMRKFDHAALVASPGVRGV